MTDLNPLRQLLAFCREEKGRGSKRDVARRKTIVLKCSMHTGKEEALALSSSFSVVSSLEGRQQLFRNELSEEVIHLDSLRRLCIYGIPEVPDLRATAWKLLLGLLPPKKSDWEEAVARTREQYKDFCAELIVVPNDENGEPGSIRPEGGAEVDVTDEDHPLAVGNNSKWNNYFRDQEIKDQIERDVMRTHPDLHFFSGNGEEAELHREEMMRALFIFAKLNPGVMYVQGMNELYAPMYYVYKKETQADSREHAEADAFFCFVNLMGEFRDNFCKQLDNSDSGIQATMGRLSQTLRMRDAELWNHLENNSKVNPQFYAFRWITLLLTQEFEFPDIMRLWDTILGSPIGRSTFLLNLCVAMLVHVRTQLLAGDFSQNLKMLQNYPPVDVGVIIQRALEMQSYHVG